MNQQDYLRNMKNPTIDIMVKYRVYHQHWVENESERKKWTFQNLTLNRIFNDLTFCLYKE